MLAIALPPFHVTTIRKRTVEVNHELGQDLDRYRAYYKRSYGADVSEADLLREMGRGFMNDDREFQTAKHGLKTRSRPPRQAISLPADPHENT